MKGTRDLDKNRPMRRFSSAAEELLRQEGGSSSSHPWVASLGKFSAGMKGDGRCPRRGSDVELRHQVMPSGLIPYCKSLER
jgi:hypothetical protein